MIADLAELQSALDRHADAGRRRWWERYLKGTAAFRGVTMGQVRVEVARWVGSSTGPQEVPAQVKAALRLLREPLSEDKLAGFLLLAEHVRPTRRLSAGELLPRLAPVFDEGHLADWNTVDWLSVKVLAAWLADKGEDCAELLVSWSTAPSMWRRRAAAVAFVPLAPRGDDAFPGLADALLRICARNVQDPARFSQTSVGWSLRELSKPHPDRVHRFVEQWSDSLSGEARKTATRFLPANPG